MVEGGVYRDTEQTWTTPVVVSVQSRVAMGHVGNSAAVFPLQLAGLEVVDVPTALLSNHPFYRGHRGRLLDAELVGELLTGITERGVGRVAAAVVSGFLGTAAVAPVVAAFVRTARDANPALRYVCDPVLGDTGPGLYVDPGLVDQHRAELVPLADVLTPNVFELEALTSPGVLGVEDVERRAEQLLGGRDAAVVVTGAVLSDTPEGCLDTVVVTEVGGRRGTWRVRSDRRDRHFDGTGDLFTALFTAAWLRGGGAVDDVDGAGMDGAGMDGAGMVGAGVVGAVAAAVGGTAAVVDRTVADRTKELQVVAVGAGVFSAAPGAVERLR